MRCGHEQYSPGRKAPLLIGVVVASILALAPVSLAHAEGGVKVLRFGMLLTSPDSVLRNALVLVKGNRIVAVTRDSTTIPSGSEVIDLSRYTGVPGLIDAHTHMTYYWDQKSPVLPYAQLLKRSPVMTFFLAQENARKTVRAGITTVRDLGSALPYDVCMRDLIKMGAMEGPRMLVCGYGIDKSPVLLTKRTWIDEGSANDLDDAVRITHLNIDAGVDWIKIYASTGGGNDTSGKQTFTIDEIRAMTEAAVKRGIPVALHSYGPDAARAGVSVGVNSIEHAIDLDEVTLVEMVRKGIYYVPTIDHNRYYANHARELGYSAEDVRKLRSFIDRNVETLRRAHRAGVKIAMGSDAVFTMFGENARELEWFVKAGMTPAEALATVTVNAARLLGMEKVVGRIAPGFYADIVALKGNPLESVDPLINGVVWVMKDGEIIADAREQATPGP